MRDREEIATKVDVVNSYMDELHEAILEMHNNVQDQQKKKISRQYDAAVFEVEAVTDWKINESSQVLLRVHWRGWEKEENSWETAIVLHEDVPAIVEDYLRAHEDEHIALSETLASLE